MRSCRPLRRACPQLITSRGVSAPLSRPEIVTAKSPLSSRIEKLLLVAGVQALRTELASGCSDKVLRGSGENDLWPPVWAAALRGNSGPLRDQKDSWAHFFFHYIRVICLRRRWPRRLFLAGRGELCRVSIGLFYHRRSGVLMAIDLSNLSVEQLDELIVAAAKRRAELEPAISMQRLRNARQYLNPAWHTAPLPNGVLFMLRHPGAGWLGFALPHEHRVHLATLWLHPGLCCTVRS